MKLNTAFRDYSTRIHFNISLTRNQIFTLWAMEQMEKNHGKGFCFPRKNDYGVEGADHFVTGARKLEAMGLVVHQNPLDMKPRWSRPAWTLTPAGTHVIALLRMAGLVAYEATNKRSAA